MTLDSTLRSLFKLFPHLQGEVQKAHGLLPEATLRSFSDIAEDDCKAVLVYDSKLSCQDAEALRISRGLPELHQDRLVVDIQHLPTLVFAQSHTGGVYIELTTSLAMTRRHLAECGSAAKILATLPGDETAKQEWHSRFENQNIHGSWFNASSKLKKAIEELGV